MALPKPAERARYTLFYNVPTRWADNDIYGHANNVVYYAWFDTVVNQFLIERGGMRPGHARNASGAVSAVCAGGAERARRCWVHLCCVFYGEVKPDI